MKMRSFTFVVGVVAALALVACKEDTTGSGGGGGIGGTGGTGGTGGAACQTDCATAISDGGDVCGGSTYLDDLVSCASGSCASECADLIMGGASDTTCGDCLQTNCTTEFNDCSNN